MAIWVAFFADVALGRNQPLPSNEADLARHLLVDGVITRETYQRLARDFEIACPESVTVRSAGGSERAAIAIGALVQACGTAVFVLDYCLSACAAYIFLASPRKSVNAGAIVSFHAYSYGLIASGAAKSLTHEERAEAEAIAVRSVDLMRKAGVDSALLVDATRLVNPSCYTRVQSGKGDVSTFFSTSFDMWVPSLSTLKSYGVAGPNNWPNPLEVSERVTGVFKANVRVNFSGRPESEVAQTEGVEACAP